MVTHAHVRRIAVAAAAASVAFTGAGLALQELGGERRLSSDAPAALTLSLAAFGLLILWHRPDNRIGWIGIGGAVAFGLGVLAAGALDYGELPSWLAHASLAWLWLSAGLVSIWALYIMWFPDGRFLGAGWRRAFVAGAAVCVAVGIAGWLLAPSGAIFDFYAGTTVPAGVAGPFADERWRPLASLASLTLLFPLAALAAPIRRYRSSGVVVRQQVKWLGAGAAASIVLAIVSVPLMEQSGSLYALGVAFSVGGQPLPQVAAAVAILRYRLWEIDLVLSRALVYALLWGALSVVLLAPALAAGWLVGGPGALTAVGLALLVTLAFRPASRRVEEWASRHVYRRRPRAYELLTAVSETLRAARDLGDLEGPLAASIRGGLGVEWAGVWLLLGDELRPVSVAGAPPERVALTKDAVAALAGSGGAVVGAGVGLPREPAAVVPLVVAGGELVGALACGERPGDPLAAGDVELLELLARECALRLRNLRLETELRERLVQIGSQAEELRRSRQRLVSAQDGERRRIERNLHDGVQQQLVALATRLRRASLEGGGGPLLGDLADEAEEAVFALQELGRGIFPSVLADRGLPAALRAQASRVALPVRVEVADGAAGLRLEPELEAALYFVCLEALANAQKHAPDASVSVRLAVDGDSVSLEVHDDGPGVDGSRNGGTGLANMADRIAAVGGSFELASGPGEGTTVRARVPAQVLERR